jgi:hypothetical protein
MIWVHPHDMKHMKPSQWTDMDHCSEFLALQLLPSIEEAVERALETEEDYASTLADHMLTAVEQCLRETGMVVFDYTHCFVSARGMFADSEHVVIINEGHIRDNTTECGDL